MDLSTLYKTTSSPEDGLLRLRFVTVPEMVEAEESDPSITHAVNRRPAAPVASFTSGLGLLRAGVETISVTPDSRLP